MIMLFKLDNSIKRFNVVLYWLGKRCWAEQRQAAEEKGTALKIKFHMIFAIYF
jgi:hypothetical protein